MKRWFVIVAVFLATVSPGQAGIFDAFKKGATDLKNEVKQEILPSVNILVASKNGVRIGLYECTKPMVGHRAEGFNPDFKTELASKNCMPKNFDDNSTEKVRTQTDGSLRNTIPTGTKSYYVVGVKETPGFFEGFSSKTLGLEYAVCPLLKARPNIQFTTAKLDPDKSGAFSTIFAKSGGVGLVCQTQENK